MEIRRKVEFKNQKGCFDVSFLIYEGAYSLELADRFREELTKTGLFYDWDTNEYYCFCNSMAEIENITAGFINIAKKIFTEIKEKREMAKILTGIVYQEQEG